MIALFNKYWFALSVENEYWVKSPSDSALQSKRMNAWQSANKVSKLVFRGRAAIPISFI